MLFNIHLVNAQGDVTIGTQIWTSKNLDVSTFRNGEAIPEAKSKEEWAKAYKNKTAAFCYYDYDNKNGKVYGKLYNWYAVNDPRGLAPKGYHIPSDEEWTILTNKLGGEEIAGKKMKSKSGWAKSYTKSVNADNSSGFNGLPGGYCDDYGSFGGFNYITKNGYFWSSSDINIDLAWNRYLFNGNTSLGRSNNNKSDGFSVRCLRD
jgi:uncharacterized protein (TIGR02145 family)